MRRFNKTLYDVKLESGVKDVELIGVDYLKDTDCVTGRDASIIDIPEVIIDGELMTFESLDYSDQQKILNAF